MWSNETLGGLKQNQTSREVTETIRNDKRQECERSRQAVDRINSFDLFPSDVFLSLFHKTLTLWVVSLDCVFNNTVSADGVNKVLVKWCKGFRSVVKKRLEVEESEKWGVK